MQRANVDGVGVWQWMRYREVLYCSKAVLLALKRAVKFAF